MSCEVGRLWLPLSQSLAAQLRLYKLKGTLCRPHTTECLWHELIAK